MTDLERIRAALESANGIHTIEPPETPDEPEPTTGVAQSTPPPRAESRYALPMPGEQWSDPHRLARLFLDEHRTADRLPTLLQWRGEYHLWDGAAWRPIPDGDLDADLARHCRDVFVNDLPLRVEQAQFAAEQSGDDRPAKQPALFPVTASVRSNVRCNLAGMANVPDDGRDPPFWLMDAANRPQPHVVVAAPNGLFQLDDIAHGLRAFNLPTPTFFTPNALPFSVESDPRTPETWLRCLNEWFNGDAASIDGLQEWFGYLLTADTSTQKVLMLVGPPRSGKGTILHVLTELAGAVNVASTSFAALGESFGLEALLGKRVAIVPDARLSGRTDSAAVVERLLSISGEDAQTVNRKNRPRITARIPARFVLASNEIPRLPDASGALASRFHILRTPNSWLGKEDRELKGKLAVELPGILKWAAKGWCRLKAQGMTFTTNTAAAEYARELEDLSSPIKAFIRECCRTGPTEEVRIGELYSEWVYWNELRHREVGSENIFGRDLRSALPHLASKQTNRYEPKLARYVRERRYIGVSIKDRAEWGDDTQDEIPI